MGFLTGNIKALKDEDEWLLKDDAIDVRILLEKPKRIYIIEGKYVILVALGPNSISNLNKTINLMATMGWKCNNLCSFEGMIHALMERI